MAQSSATVTTPSPTPPTNFSCTGATGPNPPNYSKTTYADKQNWGAGTITSPPPFFDDGSAGTLTTFATNTAALASGSGGTAGGTEGTWPWPFYPSGSGAVPASSSVAHEGAGTETVVTQTYGTGIVNPAGPLVTFSCLGNYTTSPNGQHASSLSPATNPALTTIAPTSATSGASGTDTITCTGTNFTPQSVVYANGVAMPTSFTSSTTIVGTVRKKTSAGTWPITVVTGGVVTTAAQTLTYS